MDFDVLHSFTVAKVRVGILIFCKSGTKCKKLSQEED
jgi:hypothetical protein